jgi:phenylacetate-CoA ligase
MDLATLITHFAARAPGFARRLGDAGLRAEDLRCPEDLHALPVMRKESLAELQAADPPFGGLLACDPGDVGRIFQSPGPVYEPAPRRPDPWRWATALRAAGFAPGDRVLNAFGYHLTPAGAMFEDGLVAAGCTVIPGGVGNQEQQVALLHALGVTGYIGLPSYLKALIERAEGSGVSLQLARAFVAAEPLPPSLRSFFAERGIAVRQGYGTAECGNLGYECEHTDGWHVPEPGEVLLDICDLDTGAPVPPGQTGEVVVTLLQPEYALVRFGLGDLSSLNLEPCPCGRAAPRLEGWQGRVGDAVKVRGMFLHPRPLRRLTARFPEVLRLQAVVTRDDHKDHLTLRVVAAQGPEEAAAVATLPERLAAAARDSLRFQVAVAIAGADELSADAPLIADRRTWE